MANQNPLATNLTLEQQKNLFGNAYLNMLWHCPTDLRFHYWVHLPDYYYDEEEHEYSLLVIIHGTGCAIEEYIKQAKELADKYHMAVLAPMFPGGLIQRDDFNSMRSQILIRSHIFCRLNLFFRYPRHYRIAS